MNNATKKTTKKKTKISPTQLTMAWMKRRGFIAQIVERWNPFAKVRQDLFQVIDIVAVNEDGDLIGIQVTTRGNISSRRAKVRESLGAKYLAMYNRVEVHGWQKVGPRWTVKVCTMDYDKWEAMWVEKEFEGNTSKKVTE